MKVALLMCDHVNPEFQQDYGDYSDMFQSLFPELDLITFDVMKMEYPTLSGDFDAFIGTGSRFSVYEEFDWIKKYADYLRWLYQAGKTFVGICFSHQMIGHALGGKVGKAENGWCVGVQRFMPIDLNLLMMCQDQILELPPEAEVVSSSADCPNGIIEVGSHFVGIQAHPEFTKEYDKELVVRRIDRIGEITSKAGIESLNQSVDREKVKDYILKFIKKTK